MTTNPGENSAPEAERPPLSRKEQNARSFLILVGSVLTILLLGLLLKLPLDTFTRILAVLALGALWMIGFALLDKRRESKLAAAAMQRKLPFKEISEEQVVDEAENETAQVDQERHLSGVPDDSEDTAEDAENEDAEAEDELTPFERLVQEALDSIPEEFHQRMENLVVIVEQEPDAATLAQTGAGEGQTLLGLYHGVPLTHIGYQSPLLPEQITIYQKTIERYCNYDPDHIREQVRATVLHEVAHYFGIEHDDMPIWVK